MYLIVGLGNPGAQYENTRHNVGFKVIDKLAEDFGMKISKAKFKSNYGKGIIEGEQVVLVKPSTYMNLSGEAVIQFKKFFKIEDDKVIIIYDDMDIELGAVKVRQNGGAGGHNGMKSIIAHLGRTRLHSHKIRHRKT